MKTKNDNIYDLDGAIQIRKATIRKQKEACNQLEDQITRLMKEFVQLHNAGSKGLSCMVNEILIRVLRMLDPKGKSGHAVARANLKEAEEKIIQLRGCR